MSGEDATESVERNALTIARLVEHGFTPESTVRAVLEDDLDLLEHSGRVP